MTLPRVLVVGGGIGGLSLGIALRRVGVEVEVFERAEELREVGAAVALSANGTRLLHRLGVGERLDAVATQPTALIHRDGRSGEVIASHPGGSTYRERFGAPYYGIHRVDLQQSLAAVFGDEHLHLGHAVTGVTPDGDRVTLTLDDGREVTGDVVVGADGVHSQLREHVAGPGHGPAYTGTSGFRGLVPRDALPSLPDPLAIQFWMGPDAHLLHYALGEHDDTVNFLAVLRGPDPWPSSGTNTDTGTDGPRGGAGPSTTTAEPGELLTAFEGWHPAVREMLGAVEQSPRWALTQQPPMTRWTRGRVALIGDAVHAMLPHHGQGANLSIEDAVTLAGLLATRDPDAALAEYPRRRRARTRTVALNSWDTGTLLHLADDDVAGRTDRDERLAGYLDRFAWVHAHDAGAA